jgi:hypothetical protein
MPGTKILYKKISGLKPARLNVDFSLIFPRPSPLTNAKLCECEEYLLPSFVAHVKL